jgi:hypothetical protein
VSHKPGNAHRCRRALKASLLAAALAGSVAVSPRAQTGRAWVDPPPRPETPPAAAEPGGKAQAPSSAPAAERPSGNAAERVTASPKPAEAPASETTTSAARPKSDKPDEAARQLAIDYLDFWSGPNAIALETMPEFYAARVTFHGREMPARALFELKRDFVERWPVRSYQPRPESTQIECRGEAQTCRVGTLFDFVAANPGKRRRSEGLATLELEVSTAGPRLVIVSENSRILRRGRTARLSRGDGAWADDKPEP